MRGKEGSKSRDGGGGGWGGRGGPTFWKNSQIIPFFFSFFEGVTSFLSR